ncbi:ORF4 [Fusarium oxysporum mymonavirus 1]|uniref:ORF4 n=1 Tax=Fusarium oxysporum mymonavirus 1 TaxID=2928187 RepID=A0AAX3A8R6_9MONO|nr:ORF4 [Fusarium oxysporum mymonavirus 1]UNQ75000.1 ORF4 [Fusarium oxysporum mymonavirus 1]
MSLRQRSSRQPSIRGRQRENDEESIAHVPGTAAVTVQSRFTESRALLSALQTSSAEAQENFEAVCDDVRERSEILRSVLKECRNLRLVMILCMKGEVTDADKQKARPPRLRPMASGGCKEVEEYLLRTLVRAKEVIFEDYQQRLAESKTVGETNIRLDDMTVKMGQLQTRDDDELTIISNWNAGIETDRGYNI